MLIEIIIVCFQLLTVPAFEAFGPLDPFPNNKSELVKMWDKDQLGGYR